MRFLKGTFGTRFDNVNKDDGLYWDVLGCNWAATGLQLGCTRLYLAVVCFSVLLWALLGCSGLFWTVLDCTGLY